MKKKQIVFRRYNEHGAERALRALSPEERKGFGTGLPYLVVQCKNTTMFRPGEVVSEKTVDRLIQDINSIDVVLK